MINFFPIASKDQSIYYLGQLFGPIGTVLPADNASLLLGAMFKTLNTTALVLGAFMVVHALIMGLLKTATEGEFLGKQWSSVWMPIRIVVGIGSMFPTSSGYSFLQIVLMWIIVQGIGAADAVWSTTLRFVTLAGSPYAGVSVPASGGSIQSFNQLFQMMSCEASAKGKNISSGAANGPAYTDMYQTGSGGKHPYYYCSDPIHSGEGFCTSPSFLIIPNNVAPTPLPGDACTRKDGYYTVNRNDPNKPFNQYHPATITCSVGPGKLCGTFSYGDDQDACNMAKTEGRDLSRELRCATFTAQKAALQVIVPTMQLIAGQYANYDHDYLAFTENTSASPPLNYPFMNPPPPPPPKPRPRTVFVNGKVRVIPAPPAAPTANNWTVPGWINTYCQQGTSSGPINPCCVFGKTQGNGTCTTFGSAAFPDPNSVKSGAPIDYGNVSKETIEKLIWPMALQPYLVAPTNENGAIGTQPQFIKALVSLYTSYINAALVATMSENKELPAGSWQSEAQNFGWIMAGSYYYKIASESNNNLAAALPDLTVNGTDPHMGTNQTDASLANYRNNYQSAGDLLNIISAQTEGDTFSIPGIPQLQEVGTSLNQTAADLMDSFMKTLTGGGAGGQAANPLTAIQALGERMLIAGQVLYPVFMVIMFVLLVTGNVNVMGLGTGLTVSPMRQAMIFLAYCFWALLMLFLGWLFSFGGLLAVYTPLVPYIVFTFAAIGWITATVEAMVAAPFIAMGILSMGGDNEVLGRASPSVLIMLNTFLRPSLIIFGMMAAMLMVPIVITMINAGFRGVMGSILPDPGVVELIFFISLYCLLVLAAVNKSFALIHLIPERVITWIGGQSVSYGEAEAQREVKGGVDSTISGVAGATAAGFEAAQKKGVELIKGQKKLKEATIASEKDEAHDKAVNDLTKERDEAKKELSTLKASMKPKALDQNDLAVGTDSTASTVTDDSDTDATPKTTASPKTPVNIPRPSAPSAPPSPSAPDEDQGGK
jgi:hypothetical protein